MPKARSNHVSLQPTRVHFPQKAYASHGGIRDRITLFGLAPDGVYPPWPLLAQSRALLPHVFTLTNKFIKEHDGGYFLWHFPWACAPLSHPQASILLGVRTFLTQLNKKLCAIALHTLYLNCTKSGTNNIVAHAEKGVQKRAPSISIAPNISNVPIKACANEVRLTTPSSGCQMRAAPP
ncbi:MAG: hypothetical protein UV38_C0001G0179 [candidate division TM6 bacterium GW2011_GWE2_42_60]|nr:MAG: hypothetical protein UV38_C0001G0179 [candidate division TM6 bacterium GW2011_GWE2_42_60]